MSALKQLEFMKSKIDNINTTLMKNLEKRNKDNQKMNQLKIKIQSDAGYLESLPEV